MRLFVVVFVLTTLLSLSANALIAERLLYVDVYGSYLPIKPKDTYVNVEETDRGGLGGGLGVGFRFGDWAIETGVHSYKQVWITEIPSTAGPVNELVSYQYVGVPACAKWNYIETDMSTFYVKAGAALEFAQRRTDQDLVPSQFVSAIGGIGGTAELSKAVGFLLDLEALQHFGFNSAIRPEGVVSAGFIFAL